MTSSPTSISPPTTTTEAILATDGGLEAELDEGAIGDIFGSRDGAPLLQPSDDVHVPDQAGEVAAAEGDLRGAVHKLLPDPGEPAAAEVEDHRACGHIPYRSWCRECVESRETGEQHRRRKDQRAVCVFAFDYLYLGNDGLPMRREDLTEGRGEVKVKLLVAKDTRERQSLRT